MFLHIIYPVILPEILPLTILHNFLECGYGYMGCYGAKDIFACCPTCDDVETAFNLKGWNFNRDEIDQCQGT